MNDTFIFKGQYFALIFVPLFNILSGVCGELEGEGIVGASIQGDLFMWCHVEQLSSHCASTKRWQSFCSNNPVNKSEVINLCASKGME